MVLFFSSGLEMAQKLGKENKKDCLAQARELLAKEEPLPSNFQSAIDTDNKHRAKTVNRSHQQENAEKANVRATVVGQNAEWERGTSTSRRSEVVYYVIVV